MYCTKEKETRWSKKKEADFRTKVAETELIALRSQMNPHFIFNSLNSIGDYIAKNDSDSAIDYLVKFSKLIRAILENSNKKWILLEEDLELMKLYVQLEALRLKDKLSFTIKIDEAVAIENVLIPSLLLQPFIENSIWHGIAKKKGEGSLLIEVKKENDVLVCIVEDDGVGRSLSANSKRKTIAMGVKITKNRLDIISQLKKGKVSVKMIDKEQGLRVEIRLPLEMQY